LSKGKTTLKYKEVIMGKKNEVKKEEYTIAGVIYQNSDGVYQLDVKNSDLTPIDWITLFEQLKVSMILSTGAEITKNIIAEGSKDKEAE
jgi:hypothetical protein